MANVDCLIAISTFGLQVNASISALSLCLQSISPETSFGAVWPADLIVFTVTSKPRRANSTTTSPTPAPGFINTLPACISLSETASTKSASSRVESRNANPSIVGNHNNHTILSVNGNVICFIKPTSCVFDYTPLILLMYNQTS